MRNDQALLSKSGETSLIKITIDNLIILCLSLGELVSSQNIFSKKTYFKQFLRSIKHVNKEYHQYAI